MVIDGACGFTEEELDELRMRDEFKDGDADEGACAGKAPDCAGIV